MTYSYFWFVLKACVKHSTRNAGNRDTVTHKDIMPKRKLLEHNSSLTLYIAAGQENGLQKNMLEILIKKVRLGKHPDGRNMKRIRNYFWCIALLICCAGCTQEDSATGNPTDPITVPGPTDPPLTFRQLKYLALGDSYTIGASVCDDCRFPAQLEARLETELLTLTDVETDLIAMSGWTTTNLLSAINTANPSSDYDLVTLLIGVNNQYQNRPFSLYETEFPQLLDKAIQFAKGDPRRVIVVSIPDYAYTPYGQGTSNPGGISMQIDQYNTFAMNHAASKNVRFVNITDITREGLFTTYLVAVDGLHPSQQAYARFVERLLPPALEILD